MCKDIAPALDSFSLGDGDVSTPYVTKDVCTGQGRRRKESALPGRGREGIIEEVIGS